MEGASIYYRSSASPEVVRQLDYAEAIADRDVRQHADLRREEHLRQPMASLAVKEQRAHS